MPKSLWLLVIGMMVNTTGSSFLWPLNTIYINEHLGKSLSVAGFVLMLNSAASVIGNLLGGALFDKLGGYRTVLFGIILTILAALGLTLWHDWPNYVIFLTITGFGSGIIFPCVFAMAGSVWKEGGRRAFNAIYVAQNVGVAVGSALGGFVASYSFSYIFIANLLMFIIFLLIAFFGYKNMSAEQGKQATVIAQQSRIKNKQVLKALIMLCSAYLLCWVGYVQWQATISSYTQHIGITLKEYGLLWTINGALIVIAQPVMTPLIKKFRASMKGQIVTGIIIFIISFAVVSVAHSLSAFVIAMIILTLGEMLVWPAIPTIANQLSPKGKEGLFQGIVNSTATGGRMVGPLLGGIIVDLSNMSTLFISLIGLFIISIGLSAIYDRPLKSTAKQEQTISM
ncbi:MFS transporter [Bacillus sp. FJAT-49736]|uniref:MDR family MFS transporter n=1 Tax=Bacillus sp. FJAT-49736 TaxID=2833582 RepID=UPI001BC8D19C|nr:MFS transporter [Bacillus sp. FJAT-49736]MBS4173879.1 MFS transporter [Bacillus sp. FJAT-49736]